MNLLATRKQLLENGYTKEGSIQKPLAQQYKREGMPDVWLIWDGRGKVTVLAPIGLTDVMTRSFGQGKGWEASDLISTAEENNIILSVEQAESLLDNWASKLAECANAEWSGWDVMKSRLNEVEVCGMDDCNNAIEVLGDDSDSSYATDDDYNRICESCKIEQEYVSCGQCELYSPKTEMNEVAGWKGQEPEYFHKDCK